MKNIFSFFSFPADSWKYCGISSKLGIRIIEHSKKIIVILLLCSIIIPSATQVLQAQGNPAWPPFSTSTSNNRSVIPIPMSSTSVSNGRNDMVEVGQQFVGTTSITIASNAQGWFSPQYGHASNNPNYIVGNADGIVYRNFFNFSLTGLNLVGKQIISASLSIIEAQNIINGNSATQYELRDVNSSRSMLMSDYVVGNSVANNIYTDLGTGQLYGSYFITGRITGGYRVFALNANAIADINGHIGGDFAIGGALSPPNTGEYVFGYSGASQQQQLVLQLVDATITTGGFNIGPLCAGSSVSIPFTLNGYVAANNIFTAQLSDATGSFTSPITIGSLAGTTSGNINAIIPANTGVGTGYRIRVICSNQSIKSSNNGSAISIQIAPVVMPPVNIVKTTDDSQCGASISFRATATGSASTVSYSIGGTTISSPYTFPVGTTSVVVTAINSCGADSKTFTVTVNDVTPPQAIAQDVTVSLVNGQASVTPSQVNNGSSDACGIAALSLNRANFTCADVGDNPVVLRVTDVHGNAATANAVVHVLGSPPPTITAIPLQGQYTGGVATDLYVGYGPQGAMLMASGGNTYAWSTNIPFGLNYLSNPRIANPIFRVTTPGIYTYTVSTMTPSGCVKTANITLRVFDVQCGTNQFVVCQGGQQICLNAANVNAALLSGGQLGTCRMVSPPVRILARSGLKDVSVYPNPVVEQATVSFRAQTSGTANVEVYNEMGQRVATLFDGSVQSGQVYEVPFLSHGLNTGLYVCRLTFGNVTEMMRLVVLSK